MTEASRGSADNATMSKPDAGAHDSGEDTDEDRSHMVQTADANIIFMRRRSTRAALARTGRSGREVSEDTIMSDEEADSADLEATVALGDLLGTAGASSIKEGENTVADSHATYLP